AQMATEWLGVPFGTIRIVQGDTDVVGFGRGTYGSRRMAVGGGRRANTAPNFPNGCHVCEVEIDTETGKVEIARFTAVDDSGVIINPLLFEGQIHGGIAMGIGQALLEKVAYDAASGQLLSGSFLDYVMPRADDMPSF